MSKNLAQLLSEIAANFPDNSAGGITAALLRTTVGDIALSSQLLLNDAFIVVRTAADPVANGTAALAAYAAAKLLTPNGQAISRFNRAVVILPPGVYDFGATNPPFDVEGIDWIGLTGRADDVIFNSDNSMLLVANYQGFRGISFLPTGADQPGLTITEDGFRWEFSNCVFVATAAETKSIAVTNDGFAQVVIWNCDVDWDSMPNIENDFAIENVAVGQAKRANGFFNQLQGKATLVTSFTCRPDNSATDAASISKIAMCFDTLDFGSIAAGGHAELTIPCAGLAAGNYRSACKVGYIETGPPAGLIFDAWVSATECSHGSRDKYHRLAD
jgi:hypothetical protein